MSLPGSTFIPQQTHIYDVRLADYMYDLLDWRVLAVVRYRYEPSSVRQEIAKGGRRCAETEEGVLPVRPYSPSSPVPTCTLCASLRQRVSNMFWQVAIARRRPETRQRRKTVSVGSYHTQQRIVDTVYVKELSEPAGRVSIPCPDRWSCVGRPE